MKRIKLWCALIALGSILLQPNAAVTGAQTAMRLWCTSVAPALFPFLVLMPMLTGREACVAYEMLFSRVMRPIFRLPGAAAPAIIIGMISGSPGGALALRKVAGGTQMRRAEAKRIGCVLGGVSPAYLVMGVGAGLWGSVRVGWVLALTQIASQLTLLILLRNAFDGEDIYSEVPLAQEEANPVRMALQSILVICGYMVFFSTVASAISEFIGEKAGKLLLLLTDMPSGLARIMNTGEKGVLLMQGAAIGFGGICIAAQNMDILKQMGVKWKEFIIVRCMSSAMFTIICTFALNLHQGMDSNPFEAKNIYSISMLAAAILALPGLRILTNKLFLNKGK